LHFAIVTGYAVAVSALGERATESHQRPGAK
jgi:hypothetical protein